MADTTYDINLKAISCVNTELFKILEQIKENKRYEVFAGNTLNAINILDLETQEFVYTNPTEQYIKQIDDLSVYKEYDYLYFFGTGNGFVINELLKNKKHRQIVVIEPNHELLYIALNLNNFSSDIMSGRLVFLSLENLSLHLVTRLFSHSNASVYMRLFELMVLCPYYTNVFEDDYKQTLSLFYKTISQVTIVHGNDIKDSLVGLRHHVANLPLMLTRPTIKELFTKKNSEFAIVVSTGPSLFKQLELLKKVKNYATIISVDASLPILAKEGIKPDMVTSMERVIETAEFFRKTPTSFQKGITFVCASLQHPDLLKTIKGNLVIGMRPFGYNTYFHLDEYGYICYGMSAANMAHELAAQMGFKNCILIGQDLSYGKDGKSHSKGHIYGDDQLEGGKDKIDSAEYELIDIEAYGGEGTVKSIYIWEAFRNYFEQTITETSSIMETINCTEGGARIEGSTERTFSDMVDIIIDQGKKKGSIVLTMPDKKTINANQKEVDKTIKEILKGGAKLQKNVEKAFLIIQKQCEKIEHKTKEEAFKIMNDKIIIKLLDTITDIRDKLKASNLFNEFFYEIIKPHIIHQEVELAKIKSMNVKNLDDNKEKALGWILKHRFLLFSIAGDMFYVMEEIKSSMHTSKDAKL